MGIVAWMKSFGTCNPSELFAMLMTQTTMPKPPPPDESAFQCLLRLIEEYDGMAKRARFKYVLSRWTVIVAASSIPFFAAFSVNYEWARFATGILGVVIAIVNGVEAVGKYHDKWLRWRWTAQKLILVRNAYLHKSEAAFKTEMRDESLGKRINKILKMEFEEWKDDHGDDGGTGDDAEPGSPAA